MDGQATMAGELVGLVGDIGGTHARFAIARVAADAVALSDVMILDGADYPTLEAAAQHYLEVIRPARLDAGVAACAGAVIDGAVVFTNLAWATTERSFGAAVGLARVHLINDLAAVGWAAPILGRRQTGGSGLRQIGGPVARGEATCAVLNAGTGCNASAFVPGAGGGTVVAGEYGHASFAPADELEMEIWRRLHARFGRVSIERLLSGPGLFNLYWALCGIEGAAVAAATPAAVSAAAAAGDATAGRAIELFCEVLGSVAGDVALCFGARGGVYLAGGVAVQLMTAAHDAAFRRRFAAKGRFEAYLAGIPTLLIQDGEAALLGAARAMAALAGLG